MLKNAEQNERFAICLLVSVQERGSTWLYHCTALQSQQVSHQLWTESSQHLPDQAYGFCHAVTAFKGGKQLADAQPLMQTIILGPQNKDYCFVPIITF